MDVTFLGKFQYPLYHNIFEYETYDNNISKKKVNITQGDLADLTIEKLDTDTTAYAGENISVRYTVKNTGIGVTSEAIWEDEIYLVDEDGNEEKLSQYAPDGTSDPAKLYLLMKKKEQLYEAFYSLPLREQEIIADHLGFCPECWSHRLRKDGTILKRDFNFIGLTHEIQEKAAERAYHNALDNLRRKLQVYYNA